jgi:hybrid polyketide synthase/nonribosomal peptide synthetase ACE1
MQFFLLRLHFADLDSGHTEGTAGIAGLMKASLAMKHGVIPPNLHFNEISPTVAPFYNNLNLVTSLQPWPKVEAGEPRRASVNSFGELLAVAC